MALIRRQTIGTGGDFSTPQAWFNSNRGNLVSSGLICIGELLTETFNDTELVMNNAQTDQNNFYILRARNNRFNGVFDGNYPILKQHSTNENTSVIECTVPNTVLEHFVIQGRTPTSETTSCSVYGLRVSGTIVDSVGIQHLNCNSQNNGTISVLVAACFSLGNSIVRNCSIIYTSGTVDGAGENLNRTISVYGIYSASGDLIYNNTIYGTYSSSTYTIV